MAKLPPISRFLREDFPGQDWIDRLLQPLNQFMGTVYSALNKNLSLSENCRCEIKEISITSNGSGVATSSFAWNLNSIPTDCWVSRIISGAPSSGIGIVWNYDGTSINITAFYGLANNTAYKLRIIAMNNG